MKKNEPVTEKNSYPEPPPHLSERSKTLWQEYAGPILKSPGQFALLEIALCALDRAMLAKKIISREGLLTVSNEKGKMAHMNPCLTILKEAEASALKTFKTLGLHFPGKWNSGNY
jgi:hypothetical protein